jgi:hypothetical protein
MSNMFAWMGLNVGLVWLLLLVWGVRNMKS